MVGVSIGACQELGWDEQLEVWFVLIKIVTHVYVTRGVVLFCFVEDARMVLFSVVKSHAMLTSSL